MEPDKARFISKNAIWYWKGGANPWKNDSLENWIKYSDKEIKLINKSYNSRKKEISLNHYVLCFSGMFQYSKEEPNNARPIKLEVKKSYRFTEELPLPQSKTFNDVDYLEYPSIILQLIEDANAKNKKFSHFMNEFVMSLKTISQDEIQSQEFNVNLNKMFKHLNLSIKGKNAFLGLFKPATQTLINENHIFYNFLLPQFEDFKKDIILLYTLPAKFHDKLNRCLREENDKILGKFSQYFLILDFLLKNDFKKFRWNNSVYRGCQFSPEHIEVYKTILKSDYQSFLWNSFISTSKNKAIAEIFGQNNTLIEIQFDEKSFGIDISRFSGVPDEEEVLLPARGFYKLLKISEVKTEYFQYHIIVKKIHQNKYSKPEDRNSNVSSDVKILKRIKNEFHNHGEEIIYYFPEAALARFKTVIEGPKDSPYEGGVFQLDFTIPDDYPLCPPKITFETKIWHPNIATQTGKICVDILDNEHFPALPFPTILLSIQSLLDEPNFDDSIEPAVIEEYRLQSKKAFVKTAKEWTAKYANKNEEIKEYMTNRLNKREAIIKGMEIGIFKNI